MASSAKALVGCLLSAFTPDIVYAASGELDAAGIIVLVLLILVGVAGLLLQQFKLQNLDDKSLVYIDQIIDIAELESAKAYEVSYTRQSGNEYKPTEVWSISGGENQGVKSITKSELQSVISTLRRARWEAAWVMENSSSGLSLMRNVPNGRKNEGKKLGFVEVKAIGLSGK